MVLRESLLWKQGNWFKRKWIKHVDIEEQRMWTACVELISSTFLYDKNDMNHKCQTYTSIKVKGFCGTTLHISEN